MKKIFSTFVIILFLTACGSSDSKGKQETNGTDNSKNPDYQEGLALVSKDNCFTCHKIDEPLTGPPYREVANKYAGMPDTIIAYLANKIIRGGSGNWGAIYMLPHPNLPEADAEAMVKYILSMKK